MGKARESVFNGITLKVPKELAGILPAGSSDFEVHSYLGLKHSLREGDEALDIGCSYGVMSALMGRLVGSSGRVHSLEANAEVAPMAQLLLRENGTEPRVHNAAVSDKEGEIEFHAVPGPQSVASTINPEILKAHPDSVRQKVRAVTVDGFCAENKISPRCVKIDVEGAECAVLRGAQQTLERHRPDLVIETHGLEILGVGGSLEELAGYLEKNGYKMLDMYAGERVAAGQYVSRYANKIGTMLASARMSDEELERACKAAGNAVASTQEPESADLDFTGERAVPGKVAAQLYNEHLARYAFAAGMVKGKDVLDIGCGAGYGSEFLSKAGARSVLGVDSSKEAVEYARAHYGGARFEVADAARLEADGEFDVAVAFEVLEHTKNHAEFVDSAKRALKKGGVLLVSTPNRRENPPGYSNPFHEKELDEAEFRALLEKRFEHVHLLYQSFVFGVAIRGAADAGVSRALETADMKKKYLIAVCGQQSPPRGAVFPAAFEHAEYFAQLATDSDVGTLRGLADSGKYGEAYEFAHDRSGDGAEWLYLSAFAAHMTGRHAEAVPLYDRAQREGFDEFWVRYNRGQALLSTGEAERGRKDLEAARAIDPSNEDVKRLLDGMPG